jgi:hypothetical protein
MCGAYPVNNSFLLPFPEVERSVYSPGRFFAVNEIKALLAHIIVTYDFKFEEGKGVPPDDRFGQFNSPGESDVLFKKRQK